MHLVHSNLVVVALGRVPGVVKEDPVLPGTDMVSQCASLRAISAPAGFAIVPYTIRASFNQWWPALLELS